MTRSVVQVHISPPFGVKIAHLGVFLYVVFGNVAIMKMETVEVGIDVVANNIVVDAHKESTVSDDENVGGVWLGGLDKIESTFGAVEGLLESFAVTEVGIKMKIKEVFWPRCRVGAFEFTEAALL